MGMDKDVVGSCCLWWALGVVDMGMAGRALPHLALLTPASSAVR